jgi:hypothetical protein
MKLEQEQSQSQLQSNVLAQSARVSVGTLIGVPDVPPCVMECRMGADTEGELRWMVRADVTDGAWVVHGCSGKAGWRELKEILRDEFPLHVAVWYEGDDAYQWMDC